MKKLHILVPSAIAMVSMPLIGMVSCKNESESHIVKIDSASDTTNIDISTPEIVLNQDLVIGYHIHNLGKTLNIDDSWIKFDSTQYPLSHSHFSHDNDQIIIPAFYVTTYDIAICLKTSSVTEFEVDEERVWISLVQTNRHVGFLFNSQPISVEANVTYKVTYDLSNYHGLHFCFPYLCFAQGISDEKPNLLYIPTYPTINKLIVNGEETSVNWCSCSNPLCDGMFSQLYFDDGLEITNESVIEIQLAFESDYDNFYFMVWCADWWE